MDCTRKQKQYLLQQSLKLLLPLTAVFLAVISAVYLFETDKERLIRNTDEILNIGIGTQSLIKSLEGISTDLAVLSQHDSFIRLRTPPTAENLEHLATGFLVLSRSKRIYDQIRYLDETGMEVIRVNFNDGNPSLVPQEQLQNKAQRYYFKKSISLDKGEVFVSPLDLNIEHGVVEKPLKPMIRFATPVFDGEERKKGVVILNYLGSRLLDYLKSTVAKILDHTMLVNNDGFWLLNPNPDLEWGFMLNQETRFGALYPDAWRQIQENDTGQFSNDNGLFTFETIYPLRTAQPLHNNTPNPHKPDDSPIKGETYSWKLFSYVSQKKINASNLHTAKKLMLVAGPLYLIVLIGSALLAYVRLQNRKSERALQESEQRKSTIFRTALDAIITIDYKGRVVEFNPSAEEIFGYHFSDIEGQDIMELIIPEEMWKQHKQGMDHFFTTGHSSIMGTRVNLNALRKTGEQFPIELYITPSQVGEKILVTAFIRDLTERMAAEVEQRSLQKKLRQAQKMEALGQLVGGIAHDFNNLLGIVIGNLDILKEEVGNNEQIGHQCESALKAALRGSDLTKRLLAFTRHSTQETSATNVNQVITSIHDLLERSLTVLINVELTLPDDLWLTNINPRELEDVIVNLALNARDAMPQGGYLIIETKNVILDEDYVKINPGIKPGEYIVIIVSDTGTGIPKAIQERVFDPFFSTKEQGKGTGLGLSMAYGFVKSAHGQIRIYSEEGYGTALSIYLPRTSDNTREVIVDSPDVSTVQGGNETILVVDDEPELALTTEKTLARMGYHVLTAGSASEALNVLKDHPGTDLVFSDVTMPGDMDGYALAQEVKKHYPALKVLLTSGFTNRAANKSHEEMNSNLLSKPYRNDDLIRRVRKLLDSG